MQYTYFCYPTGNVDLSVRKRKVPDDAIPIENEAKRHKENSLPSLAQEL